MTTRIAVRARCPDWGKGLRVIRSYESYARFEATFSDITHLEGSDDRTAGRVEELKYESAKTLEALKKKPVRIPEMYVAGEASKTARIEAGSEHARCIAINEVQKLHPLKTKECRQPHNFIRYISRKEDEADPNYNYEAAQSDLLFLTELKGSPFTVQEFEEMINILERENAEESAVLPLESLSRALEPIVGAKPRESVEKVYEVSRPHQRSTGKSCEPPVPTSPYSRGTGRLPTPTTAIPRSPSADVATKNATSARAASMRTTSTRR